jgi:hypothetical protein
MKIKIHNANGKWKNGNCEVCNRNDWEITNQRTKENSPSGQPETDFDCQCRNFKTLKNTEWKKQQQKQGKNTF